MDDKYYLFKSLLYFLSQRETIGILDLDFKQDVFKIKLILEKIQSDLKLGILKEHRVFFGTLLKVISKLDYHKNQKVAEFLFEISLFMEPKQQKELINYFLNSKYVNNYKRAFDFLLGKWDDSFSELLIQSWEKFENEDALEVIVKKLPEEYLDKILESLCPYFSEEEINNDFELKILRNLLYARKSKTFSSEIKKLKKDDPISYLYIKKELKEKVEKDFAIQVYNKYLRSRRYLPKWYAEMGMWDVLSDIVKNEEHIS